ncbi:acyltransferase [Microbacterium sp. p3-SID336]|uniref:acyltransferase family protein n=1 Tax=Microbacterium sp. p3-SID336 TaxID=2916212 RepID=UPI0021A406F4|nr:acyltransferase [Microbacterium sp. p3-SID336]MCT1477383.1 acyltransferase [Microbacterium sp. p3-SID336]
MAIAPAPHTTVPKPAASGHRDTGIDFVRALCVLGVVLLHAIMVGVTVADEAPLFQNASDGTGWIAPLSWLLQVMPLFFVIGGFSGMLAYRRQLLRGSSARDFIAGRVHRLLRPALVTVAAVGLALALLTLSGVPAELIEVAGFRYGQPLWFLAVFLLCQALLPAFVALHDRAPLRTIGALAAAAVAVDVLRAVTGQEALGFLNLAFVWLALQQLGFFLADGRIDALTRRTRIVASVAAVLLLVALFLTGVYSPDLIANINPPTAALLLVGVGHTALLSLHRDRLARLSRRTPVVAFTAFVTRRTMTIYLWHMPVLLAMAGASAVFALTTGFALPALDSADWWAGRPLWLLSALALTAVVAVWADRFETHPAPVATGSRLRLTAAVIAGLLGVVLLLAVGTSVTTVVVAVALLAAATHLARRRVASPEVLRVA